MLIVASQGLLVGGRAEVEPGSAVAGYLVSSETASVSQRKI